MSRAAKNKSRYTSFSTTGSSRDVLEELELSTLDKYTRGKHYVFNRNSANKKSSYNLVVFQYT